EQLQAAGAPVPEYVLVAALGPDHRRTFRVELRVGGQTLALGEGRTIKLAQQEAARSSLTEPELINSVLAAHIQMLDDEIEIVEDETADVEYLAEMASDDESNDEEETPCCQRATLAFDGQKSALSDETEEELMLTNAPTDFQTEKKIG
ncbi:MAG TPA: putative dsRNA-binding protein, partial [Blastocatellia bacterium]